MGKGLILAWAFALLAASGMPAAAQDARTFIPEGAKLYAPVLVLRQKQVWPRMPEPWTLAGLVEQESCVSLRHSKCWNPRAELKTSREYGFGFGQITVAYRADGTERFNKFEELRRAHPSLKDWEWANRHDPSSQLTAIVEMCLGLWRTIPPADTVDDHLAFMLSSYNGGIASNLQDRRLCDNTAGCDSGRWFGNVERTSLKSKVPRREYGGQSWFSINRGYVRNVMMVRRAKYRIFWEPAA